MITTKPSNVIPHATGIPPHVELYKKLDIILNIIQEEREERKKFDEAMSIKLSNAIDEKAAASGQITASVLEDLLKRRENEFAARVDVILREHFQNTTTVTTQPNLPQPVSAPLMTRDGYVIYAYGSKLDWEVPLGWTVPKDCSLKTAFNLWHNGLKGDDGVHTVRPYKLLTRLPPREKKIFRLEWKPILTMMCSCPSLNPVNCTSEENILSEFDKCVAYVLEKVSYIKDCKKHCSWTISTWSKRISNSSIKAKGNEEDKRRLTSSRYNKPHSSKRKFVAGNSATVKQARLGQGLTTMGLNLNP